MNREAHENSGLNSVDAASREFPDRVIFVQRKEVCMSTPGCSPLVTRLTLLRWIFAPANSTKRAAK